MSRAVSILCAAPVLIGPLAAPRAAQSNGDPGIDVLLAEMGDIRWLGRTGAFPNGENGIAMATTICNVGTVVVPWRSPMDPDHPFITFLLAKEEGGRLLQISDRSYVKHGFFALTSSFCDTCSPPGGDPGEFLGLGCSDTYSVGNNGNNYWLAPPDEIDPWLGAWTAQCGQFDRGEPPVAPPDDCDGDRSLTQQMAGALGPVGHRIRVHDDELDAPGATFWYQGFYVVAGELEANRANNLATRRFSATWDGSEWDLDVEADALQNDTVLARWSGATVDSATNGSDDGRVYVAVRVSGPSAGLYRYEYAVHNRDNARGIDELRFPLAPGVQVQNLGFRDVDRMAGTDWTASVAGAEVVFEDLSPSGNALRWNSIYNFWFDADAPPVAGTAELFAADPGPGSASFGVPTSLPGHAASTEAFGCGANPGILSVLAGSPRVGETVTLGIDHPGGSVAPGAGTRLLRSFAPHALHPCGGAWRTFAGPRQILLGFTRSAWIEPPLSGETWTGPGAPAAVELEIPDDLGLLGRSVYTQGMLLDRTRGMLVRMDLTEGIELRIGL